MKLTRPCGLTWVFYKNNGIFETTSMEGAVRWSRRVFFTLVRVGAGRRNWWILFMDGKAGILRLLVGRNWKTKKLSLVLSAHQIRMAERKLSTFSPDVSEGARTVEIPRAPFACAWHSKECSVDGAGFVEQFHCGSRSASWPLDRRQC